MSRTVHRPEGAARGGGKTYGYQEPAAPAEAHESLEDDKAAVVSAFDHFLDSLAAKAGSGYTAPAPRPSADGGPKDEDTGSTTGTASTGSADSGTSPAGTGTASTGSAGTGTASTGSAGTGTGSPPSSTGNGHEATEASIYSLREAFRADRARETAKRAQRPRSREAAQAAVSGMERAKNQSDSNRAPLSRTKEFGPSYGARGRQQRPTREVVAVPATKRPETVPADGKAAGLKPIDAYWGSYGTAVERATVRARVDNRMLESVIGSDERKRVTDTESYPYRCICSLLITAASGTLYVGTGWLVAPRLLLTAGHCVYMSDEGGWVREIEVIPGRDADERPFGSVMAREFRSVGGWTQDGDSEHDYGAIMLPPGSRLGDDLGWFGYTTRDDGYLRGIQVNVSGYPADGGPDRIDGTQWTDSRTIDDVHERQLTYQVDTYGGQSGAPVWEMTSTGERYGVGIHTYGTSVQNGGTRITGDVFDNVLAWAGEVP